MTMKKYEKWKEKKDAQVNKIQERMDEKRYLLTICQVGDETMSNGDIDRKVYPRRTYQICSTNELPEVLKFTQEPFWTHEDLLEDHSNAHEIPLNEKRWGRYSEVIIEPFTEELEKSYVSASESGFFKMKRDYHDYKMKEVA